MSILDILPEPLRAQLRALTPTEIRDIADSVRIDRMHAEQAEFPTDTHEGIDGVKSVLRRDYQRPIDDPIFHAINTLALLRLACVSGQSGDSSLDSTDLQAMVYLIDDAFSVLKEHEKNTREINARLRQITHPIKK